MYEIWKNHPQWSYLLYYSRTWSDVKWKQGKPQGDMIDTLSLIMKNKNFKFSACAVCGKWKSAWILTHISGTDIIFTYSAVVVYESHENCH